jgi:hypothetical protein
MAIGAEYVAKHALIELLFAMAELEKPPTDPLQQISRAKHQVRLAMSQLSRIAPGVFEQDAFSDERAADVA